MCEIDDAHDAKYQGQSDPEKEQQRCLRQRIDAFDDEEGEEVHGGAAPFSILERHLVAGRGGFVAWEGSDDFWHRMGEALGLYQLDDRATLHSLMVAFADRDMTLDVVDLDCLQRVPQG